MNVVWSIWMRIRLLGSIDILRDGVARPVAGRRGSTLLAALALSPNEVVDSGQLVEMVWGPAAIPAANTLQTQLSHLRRRFGLEIAARGSGYMLQVDDDGTDVL